MSTSTQNTQVMEMLRWLLIAIFVVLGWIVLRFLAGVLAPILAALGIAYMLDPALARLVRRGVPRMLGAAILLALCVTTIVAAVTFAAPRVYDQLLEFVGDLPRMLDNLSGWLHAHVGVDIPADWKSYVTKDHLQGAFTGGPLRELATAAVGGVFHLLGVMAEMLLIPVFSFYFLVDWPNLLHRIDHMIPPRRRREVREIAREIDSVVAGWVRGQAIVTTILAILYAIGFSLVGMPLSLPIGLLVGALTVIPFVGTFVGAAIAALVTVADGGSMQTLGMVTGVILCLHLLEAGVLTPKIVGHRVGLSESGALFAVVAGGKLLGFVGVVLAVPIAATCAVLVRYAVRYYEHTAFFGRESDADVVITPAMALVMPGVRLGGEILKDLQAAQHVEASTDDWAIEDEAPPPPPTEPESQDP
ncbi:MAG: AI-2E family transporter [Deltaproteobacteria bacterium]|nr:AI-2E family transporter [Deltaproteobacteria bacterium]